MTELLAVLALYLAGCGLIVAGAFLTFGLGPCMLVAGASALIAARAVSRGVARVAPN